tara:strand:- start:272 stop:676 length:405 start_codon:yes stop_codon:yes gene_type:complete
MKKNDKLIQAKSFGKVFTIVFFIFASYSYYKNLFPEFYIFILISLIFIFLYFTKPEYFFRPSVYWLQFGRLLGLIFSPIFISFLFFFVFLPTSIFMKILSFNKKFDNYLNFRTQKCKSYWITEIKKQTDFKRQF